MAPQTAEYAQFALTLWGCWPSACCTDDGNVVVSGYYRDRESQDVREASFWCRDLSAAETLLAQLTEAVREAREKARTATAA